ncbi:NAD-dependent epimerase/dehydratase family protein [bacterium]|nr:NAD-dependent epimerase/dehydratase family protein [bacterium]
MPRKYLVTGGLGFLGIPLVRALLKAGHRVRVFDNSSRGSEQNLGETKDDIELLAGDIRDAEAVRSAHKGMDSVLHLAFVNGTEYFYTRPAYVLDVGVRGMMNVIDWCLKEGVKELALASSSEVYQTPPTVPTTERVPLSIPDPLIARYSYAGGKILSELMAINYGRESFERVVIFRPHNVYGPNAGWEHVIPQFIVRLRRLMGEHTGAWGRGAAQEKEIPFSIQGTGDQTRAFVHVDDFTAGVMLLLKKGEHLNVYNIGTMEEIKVRDLALAVARHMGARVKIVQGPAAEGGTPRRCPDTTKIQALGYSPRVSFEKGLASTVDWYMAKLKASAGEE